MTVTDTPEQADLGTRLAMAQAAVAPLRERVSQLEQDLNAALEHSDFETAHKLQAELGPARQEYGVAEATARVLAEMQQEIEDARQAEQQRITEQRRRQEMQQQAELIEASEAEHLEEMHHLLAAARAGVAAIRGHLEMALSHESEAARARQEAHNLRAAIEGVQPGRVGRVSEVTGLIEGGDPILQTIYTAGR